MTISRRHTLTALTVVAFGSALFAVAAAGQTPQDAAASTESPAAEPSAERPVEAATTEASDEDPSPFAGEPTAQTTAPAEGQADAASRRPVPIRYERNAVLLVVMLIALLSFLFWLLLKWSHQLDQASYLGQVYSESVEDFEYKRLAGVATEKLRNAEYQREIVRDSEWLLKNPKPTKPEGVEAEDYWPPGTGNPGLARARANLAKVDDAVRDRNHYWALMDEWRSKVDSEADARYRRELAEARSRAGKRAKLATDVDLSTLRGRGAEFVLEFTTVVVIIFAAVILGVLNILGTEQIGTLLAAIAGYVLGRATTRPRSGPRRGARSRLTTRAGKAAGDERRPGEAGIVIRSGAGRPLRQVAGAVSGASLRTRRAEYNLLLSRLRGVESGLPGVVCGAEGLRTLDPPRAPAGVVRRRARRVRGDACGDSIPARLGRTSPTRTAGLAACRPRTSLLPDLPSDGAIHAPFETSLQATPIL